MSSPEEMAQVKYKHKDLVVFHGVFFAFEANRILIEDSGLSNSAFNRKGEVFQVFRVEDRNDPRGQKLNLMPVGEEYDELRAFIAYACEVSALEDALVLEELL